MSPEYIELSKQWALLIEQIEAATRRGEDTYQLQLEAESVYMRMRAAA